MSVGASQAAFAANSFVTGCLVLARIERVCINYAHVTVCMGTVPCYWASERLLNRKSAAGCLKGSVEKNESRLRSVRDLDEAGMFTITLRLLFSRCVRGRYYSGVKTSPK